MRILLISINKWKMPRPALPMGIALISSALKITGHTVHVLDLCWEIKDHISVIKSIQDFDPQVIGISIRNIDNVTFLEPITFIPQIRKVMLCCRKYSNAKIIFGGTGFSICPMEMMDYLKPDFGIVGEGEESLCMLINYIENGSPGLKEIPGLCYHEDNIDLLNPIVYGNNLCNKYVPDRTIYDRRYFIEVLTPLTEERFGLPGFETVQTRRGCDLECSYCIINKTQGSNVRTKEPKLVIEEIDKILSDNPEVREIEFSDSTFNYPYSYGIELCEAILKSNLSFKWFCELSPKFVTKELIRLLEKSGCYRVEIGIDSFTDIGLENLGKGYSFADVVNVDMLFRKSSIDCTHCVFIAGPGENESEFLSGIENSKLLNPTQMFITLGIRIYRNTQLYELAVKKGIINYNKNMLVPAFYIEPDILQKLNLMDIIEKDLKNRKNWYLWWGLKNNSLKDLIKKSLSTLAEIETDFKYEIM